jgi:large subunit ribosomal protein L9
MKVLLHTDIERLGYFGDVVEVADGYARNYLLPQGLAIQPTESNLRAIQKEKALQTETRRLALEKLKKVADEVSGTEVVIQALANAQGYLFGSVSESDIAGVLQGKGFEVRTKHVRMPEHFRTLGDYEVKIHFGPEVEAKVQVQVVRPTDEANDNESESIESQESSEPGDES